MQSYVCQPPWLSAFQQLVSIMYPATMMSFQWSDAWFYSWFFLLPLFFFRATFAQMMLAPELNEIVAAGGVVLERTNETVRVVLIHRPKYDDWSLPKGKSEPGESISQTALREVKEETGLDCKIVSELEPVRYSYRTGKGTIVPKVVHYFLMEPMGGRLEAPGQEADAAEWCDVTEALRRLTHQHDRELVQKAVRRK